MAKLADLSKPIPAWVSKADPTAALLQRQQEAADILHQREVALEARIASEPIGAPSSSAILGPAEKWTQVRIAGFRQWQQQRRGKKKPVIEGKETVLQAPPTEALLAGVGVLLAYEVGVDIAHGLAGMNPGSWWDDIVNAADWLAGIDPSKAPKQAPPSTPGQYLMASVMNVLVPGETVTSSGSSSGGGGTSAPPPTPPVTASGPPPSDVGSQGQNDLSEFEGWLVTEWRHHQFEF